MILKIFRKLNLIFIFRLKAYKPQIFVSRKKKKKLKNNGILKDIYAHKCIFVINVGLIEQKKKNYKKKL